MRHCKLPQIIIRSVASSFSSMLVFFYRKEKALPVAVCFIVTAILIPLPLVSCGMGIDKYAYYPSKAQSVSIDDQRETLVEVSLEDGIQVIAINGVEWDRVHSLYLLPGEYDLLIQKFKRDLQYVDLPQHRKKKRKKKKRRRPAPQMQTVVSKPLGNPTSLSFIGKAGEWYVLASDGKDSVTLRPRREMVALSFPYDLRQGKISSVSEEYGYVYRLPQTAFLPPERYTITFDTGSNAKRLDFNGEPGRWYTLYLDKGGIIRSKPIESDIPYFPPSWFKDPDFIAKDKWLR